MAKTTNEKQNNTLLSEAMSPLFTGRKTIYIDPIDLSKNENVLAISRSSTVSSRFEKISTSRLVPIMRNLSPTSKWDLSLVVHSCLCREPLMITEKLL